MKMEQTKCSEKLAHKIQTLGNYPEEVIQPLKFILLIIKLDAQFFLTIRLFHASTCFEHHVLIVSRSKLYYTASGIITPVGGRPDGHL